MEFEDSFTTTELLRIRHCILEGWQVMTGNYWPSVGVSFVGLIMSSGGGIPLVAPLVALILSGPVTAGVCKFAIHTRRGSARFDMLFGGFERFGACVGLYFLFMLIQILFVVPYILIVFGILIAAGAMEESFNEAPLVFILLAFALFIPVILASIWVSTRLALAYPLLIDKDLGAIDSLKRSWHVTKGHSLRLFVLYLLLCFIGFMSMLLLYLPFLFLFCPLAIGCFGVVYERLACPIDEDISSAFE